jgi:ribonuclease HI
LSPAASAPPAKLVLHVDGGARGNPGPAAIGVVISQPDGAVVDELAERIGTATNNVAEYRAVLRGLERAAALGAREVEVIGDSELVARQLTGAYKVKHPAMRLLYEQAITALGQFDRWRIRTVPRAQNAHADMLVNRALDGAAPAAR